MTFEKFEKLVKCYCPKVYSVTQKAHTQDGGVLVTFSENGQAYLYKGSYFSILSKLGMNFISEDAINCYIRRINGLKEDNVFGLSTFKYHNNLIESIKKEANSYIGAIIVNCSGDDLGIFKGL